LITKHHYAVSVSVSFNHGLQRVYVLSLLQQCYANAASIWRFSLIFIQILLCDTWNQALQSLKHRWKKRKFHH